LLWNPELEVVAEEHRDQRTGQHPDDDPAVCPLQRASAELDQVKVSPVGDIDVQQLQQMPAVPRKFAGHRPHRPGNAEVQRTEQPG
jgi:hypothetical protein